MSSEARFGGSELTLEFSGFKYKKSDEQTSARATTLEPVTSFDNIDSDTWTQVSKLMNMFANYSSGESGQSVREGTEGDIETNATPTNLATWTATGNAWINEDIQDTRLNEAEDQGVKWTVNSTQKVITGTDSEATLKHNGVEWKYSNPGASGSTGRDGSSTQETINNL